MKISYSKTLDAWVWHYSIVPSEYGEVVEMADVVVPDFRTGPDGRYSDSAARVKWVEALLAQKNSPEQQERFLAAQAAKAEKDYRHTVEQVRRYGSE